MSNEPQIHSHVSDRLSDDHPLAHVTVACARCGKSVHVGNECMATWFEFGNANVCASCVGALPEVLLTNQWPFEVLDEGADTNGP